MSTWLYQISPARAGMPDAPTPEEEALVGAHFAYLSAAHAQGTVTWVARTLTTPHLGLATVEAGDEVAAQAFLTGDPAVAAGAFVGRIQPLSVVFPHRGAA
jgi:hypothetical protein